MKRLLLLILLSVGFIFTSNVFAKNIPANAHKVGNSWTCNVNFYRNDSRTGCIKVPANSFSAYNSNIFKCKSGFVSTGTACRDKDGKVTYEKETLESGEYYSLNYVSILPKCKGTQNRYKTDCVGTYTWNDGDEWDGVKYVGEYKNDNPHGQGVMTWPDGYKYVGQWLYGEMSGQGITEETSGQYRGQKYYGEFKNSRRSGQGVYTYPSGEKQAGEWRNDNRNGLGMTIFSDGTKDGGIYKDDVFQTYKKYVPKNAVIKGNVWSCKAGYIEIEGLICLKSNSKKISNNDEKISNYYEKISNLDSKSDSNILDKETMSRLCENLACEDYNKLNSDFKTSASIILSVIIFF